MDEARKLEMTDLDNDYGGIKRQEFERTERDGMVYHENYHDMLCNSTVTLDNKVRTFSGQHKVVLREGRSDFGPEIIIQSCLRGKAKPYKAKTRKNYPTTEIYFPANRETLDFLRKSLFRIEREMERING
jgi:hypothetical protein